MRTPSTIKSQPDFGEQPRRHMIFANRSILVIGTESWFGPLLSKQHLVIELCKHNRVMYLEPFYHAGGLLRGRFPRDLYHEKYHDEHPPNLSRLKPWRLPKSDRLAPARKASEWLLLAHLRRCDFRPDLIISFNPLFAYLKKHLDALLVYYCVDHQAEQQAEAETLAAADMTLAATKVLYERFRGRARRLEFLPHGVILPTESSPDEQAKPKELERLAGPVAGYVGALNSCLNVDLLEALSRSIPDLNLVLIGPYTADSFGGGLPPTLLERLRKLPRTLLLGPKASRELGEYIKAFDVCLVPYDTAHPRVHFSYHKVLQYLAYGKPVITTCFAPDDILPPHTSIADGAEFFTAAVQRALITHDALAVEECRAFARANTWEQRVRQLAVWVEELERSSSREVLVSKRGGVKALEG